MLSRVLHIIPKRVVAKFAAGCIMLGGLSSMTAAVKLSNLSAPSLGQKPVANVTFANYVAP